MYNSTYSAAYTTTRAQTFKGRAGFDQETGLPLNFSPIGKLKVRPEMYPEYKDEYREWDVANALEDRDYQISLNVNKLRKHMVYPNTNTLGGATTYHDDYPGYPGARKRGLIKNIKPVKGGGDPFSSDTTYVKDYPDHGPRGPNNEDRLRNNPNLRYRTNGPGYSAPFDDAAGGTYRADYPNWGPQPTRGYEKDNGGRMPDHPFTSKSLYQDSFHKPTAYPDKYKRPAHTQHGELPLFPLANTTMYRGDYCKRGIGRPDFTSSLDLTRLRQMDSKTLKAEKISKYGPYARGDRLWGETEYQGEICRQGDIAPAYLERTYAGHQSLWKTGRGAELGASMLQKLEEYEALKK